MGNDESVQQNPHFTDPYGGHLRSPNEIDDIYYPNTESYITNNGYHKQSNKNIKNSLPKNNKPEFVFSAGHSLTDTPFNSPHRKYSDLEVQSSPSRASSKPRRNSSISGVDANSEGQSVKHISKQPFYSIWSIKCSDSLSPHPRVGHFYATASGSNKTYIGFGKHESDLNTSGSKDDKVGIPVNEIWEFDHKTYLWKRILLHGSNIKEREESVAAAFINNFTNNNQSDKSAIIYVFGGKNKSKFFSDLLKIDASNGTVTTIKSKNGNPPPDLAGAFIGYYNAKIYIWGGYNKNGDLNQKIFVYDTHQNSWSSKLLGNIPGRCNASSVTTDDGKMYIYGGQKEQTGLLEIDLNTLTAQIITTNGLAPIPDYNYGRLLKVNDYLFYFGGKANNKYTMLYTLDLKRYWWFVFNIKPDNETVTVSEGRINDNGLFLIPRIHSFGCCYSEENHSIVAFLGHPEKDPPPLFILYVGDAFGFINLRDDMLTIMNHNPGDSDDEEVPIDSYC